MSDFKQNPQELDARLNSLLDQLPLDPVPAGFTARTMEAIRPQFEPEPFRMHWSDFVPAFVTAVIGAIVLFIWLGAAGAHSIFEATGTNGVLGTASDSQVTIFAVVVGLALAAIPLLRGNSTGRNLWFFSAI